VEIVIFHGFRLLKTGFIFAREGVFSLIDPKGKPKLVRLALKVIRLIEKKNADGLPKALTRLGPTYVKTGQFLATRPDIVGATIALNLTGLQDKVPPFSQNVAVALLEEAFNAPISTLYESFSEPVAAASVAQVHKAMYHGREVAVKVLRPKIEERFAKDLSDNYFAARFASLIPALKRLKLVEVVDTLKRSMTIEMDLRLEAAALSEMRQTYANDPEFYVPDVIWNMTTKNILTLEWIDGIKLNDTAALKASHHDLPNLAKIVLQTFLKNALRDGFFHADMHQGNLFVDKQGRLVAIDFGIMGRLGDKERLFLAQILYGFITRDYDLVAEWHFRAGYVPAHHSKKEFSQAIRAIGEPIHSLPADQISMANLLGQLFDVTAIFEMETRSELVLLQKTMVVAEGVARSLDPNFNMWTTAEPIIEDWLKTRLGPVGILKEIRNDLEKGLAFLKEAPEFLTQLKSVKPITQKPSYNLPLWVIAGLLAFLAFK
jgi:ubiquinone biosynthesis protein